ncbi:unnamed protein product [Colias eurytheme]|nr:unnamed protein product [Colias eurytheme]
MYISCSIVFLIASHSCIDAAPPAACFAKFRWEDCGRAPVPVMYYWRPGSRCEVGLWRGCLPNLNMFDNEYECVATCIYTSRAAAADYHLINAEEEHTFDIEAEVTTNAANVTAVTEMVNATVADKDQPTTVVDSSVGNGTAAAEVTTAAPAI